MTPEEKASYDFCYGGWRYYRMVFERLKYMILDDRADNETLREYLEMELEIRKIGAVKTKDDYDQLLGEK